MLKYIWTVIKHKWFFMIAAREIGVSIWDAILHDLSKFSWVELQGYSNWFCGDKSDALGMTAAWNHHVKRNAHHPEHWMEDWRIPNFMKPFEDTYSGTCKEMPYEYIQEMVCDWMAASKAYAGTWNMLGWLNADQLAKKHLHPYTRSRVVYILGKIGYIYKSTGWI